MTFQQINYFIQVAKIGSISETAKRMYVSQSSISSAIREIESHYGIQAFERNAKGVSLTDNGRTLLSGLLIVAKQMEVLECNYQKESAYSMGFSVAAQHHVCGFDAFQKVINDEKAKSYRFNYVECWTSEIYEHVKSGRADIGVFFIATKYEKTMQMELERRNLEYHELHREKIHAIFRDGHPLADRQHIFIKDLHDYPCLTYDYFGGEDPIHSVFVTPYAKKIGVGDRACAYTLMRTMDAFMTGAGYKSEDPAYRDIILRPVEDGDDIMVGWICRRDFQSNEFVQKFISMLE